MAHGEINHIEFPADDPERAKRFYEAVAGWEFSTDRGHAGLLGLPHRARATAAPSASAACRPARSLRDYIEVDSIEDALAAAERTGGTVKEPKQDIPGMGWFAVVTDPEGTEVGLFQSAPRRLTAPAPAASTHPPMRLVDSHCHLQADRFDDDVDEVIAAAREAGVERILVPGWNAWSSAARARARRARPWLDAAVGVHPHDAARVDDDELGGDRGVGARPAGRRDRRDGPRLRPGLLADPRPAREPPPQPRPRGRDRQAGDPPLPLAARGSARRRTPSSRSSAAFGGDAAAASSSTRSAARSTTPRRCSSSAPRSRSRASSSARGEEATADVVRLAPADRLLVETDSPFLSPPGAPRGRNEPEWVRITAAWVADQRTRTRGARRQLVATYDRMLRGPPASTRADRPRVPSAIRRIRADRPEADSPTGSAC